MRQVKISIIIPVYNVEKYLSCCVESIFRQNYENIEIILVDDGSTDGSALLCDEFALKDERVVVIHKKNGGLSDARNSGIEKASGDYILFVDSDDYIENNSLNKIAEVVNENFVDVVFLEVQKYYGDENIYIPLGDGINKNAVYKRNKREVLKFLSHCPKYPASAGSKLVKRELFADGSLLFEKGLLSEDLDWSMKLFILAETFDYCDTMYYNYRQNREGSITYKIRIQNVLDILSILEKWCNFALSRNIIEKEFVMSQMAYELPIVIYMYNQLRDDERKQVKGRIKNLLYILKYRNGLKYRGIEFLCKALGIGLTSCIIDIFYRRKCGRN